MKEHSEPSKEETRFKTSPANLLKIKVQSMEVLPFARVPAMFLLETALSLKLSGYNLEELLSSILEDYPTEEVLKVINDLTKAG